MIDMPDDEWLETHMKQGILIGKLALAGLIVVPVMVGDNYSHDEIEVKMDDPLIEGNILTFTLVTKHWKSE